MAFAADYHVLSGRLDDEVRVALQPARALLTKIIRACSHIPILGKAGKPHRIDRLIETQAWTDCALALLEVELPAWKVRRLVYEGGEWFCSLSRQPNLPMELDDTVDASHAVLSLAILRAFVEARHRTGIAEATTSAPPRLRSEAPETICCDNFS